MLAKVKELEQELKQQEAETRKQQQHGQSQCQQPPLLLPAPNLDDEGAHVPSPAAAAPAAAAASSAQPCLSSAAPTISQAGWVQQQLPTPSLEKAAVTEVATAAAAAVGKPWPTAVLPVSAAPSAVLATPRQQHVRPDVLDGYPAVGQAVIEAAEGGEIRPCPGEGTDRLRQGLKCEAWAPMAATWCPQGLSALATAAGGKAEAAAAGPCAARHELSAAPTAPGAEARSVPVMDGVVTREATAAAAARHLTGVPWPDGPGAAAALEAVSAWAAATEEPQAGSTSYWGNWRPLPQHNPGIAPLDHRPGAAPATRAAAAAAAAGGRGGETHNSAAMYSRGGRTRYDSAPLGAAAHPRAAEAAVDAVPKSGPLAGGGCKGSAGAAAAEMLGADGGVHVWHEKDLAWQLRSRGEHLGLSSVVASAASVAPRGDLVGRPLQREQVGCPLDITYGGSVAERQKSAIAGSSGSAHGSGPSADAVPVLRTHGGSQHSEARLEAFAGAAAPGLHGASSNPGGGGGRMGQAGLDWVKNRAGSIDRGGPAALEQPPPMVPAAAPAGGSADPGSFLPSSTRLLRHDQVETSMRGAGMVTCLQPEAPPPAAAAPSTYTGRGGLGYSELAGTIRGHSTSAANYSLVDQVNQSRRPRLVGQQNSSSGRSSSQRISSNWQQRLEQWGKEGPTGQAGEGGDGGLSGVVRTSFAAQLSSSVSGAAQSGGLQR